MKLPAQETINCSNCPRKITRPVGVVTQCACGQTLGITVTR